MTEKGFYKPLEDTKSESIYPSQYDDTFTQLRIGYHGVNEAFERIIQIYAFFIGCLITGESEIFL